MSVICFDVELKHSRKTRIETLCIGITYREPVEAGLPEKQGLKHNNTRNNTQQVEADFQKNKD